MKDIFDALINEETGKDIIIIGTKIILIIIFTIIVLVITSRVFKKMLKNDKYDIFRLSFIRRFIKGFTIFIGLVFSLYQIPFLKTLSLTLFASSGILAVILGFASQEAFSNFISGFFIVLFKPFKVGNVVKMTSSDILGIVEDITLRHTIIRTFENKRIIVPNAVINKEIIENADIIDQKVCKFFDIGISYDSDIDKAIAIIKDEILMHPNHLDIRTEEEKNQGIEEIMIKVLGYGDSAVDLRTWLWAENNGKAFHMSCDLYKTIKKRYDDEGIEIPYPHRTIVLKASEKMNNN